MRKNTFIFLLSVIFVVVTSGFKILESREDKTIVSSEGKVIEPFYIFLCKRVPANSWSLTLTVLSKL